MCAHARRAEGTAVAVEDVGGGGLREGADAVEGEQAAGHLTGDGPPGGLGVDAQGGGLIQLPDLGDVAVEVAGQQRGVQDDAVGRAERAQILAAGGND